MIQRFFTCEAGNGVAAKLVRMQGVPYSMQSMLKDGHKMLSGLEEAVMKNIEACKQLSTMARTSMGPNGAFDFAR